MRKLKASVAQWKRSFGKSFDAPEPSNANCVKQPTEMMPCG